MHDLHVWTVDERLSRALRARARRAGRRLPRMRGAARAPARGALRSRPHDPSGRSRRRAARTGRDARAARAPLASATSWQTSISGQDRDRHRRLERDRRRDRARPAGGRRARRRRRTRVERLETEIALELDVTDPASCERFVDAAVAAARRRSTSWSTTPASRSAASRSTESTEEDEEVVLETNVNGLVRMTRLCLPHLARRRPHRQHGLDRGPPGIRERCALHRLEVRGARLHLRAARGPPRPADPHHHGRPGPGRVRTSRACASGATRRRPARSTTTSSR